MIEILESIFLGVLIGAIFAATGGLLLFGMYTLVQVCQEIVAVWEDFKRNRM